MLKSGAHNRCSRRLIACLVLTGSSFLIGCIVEPSTEKPTQKVAFSQNGEAHSGELISSGLLVSPDAYDFAKNPELLNRILAGPHGYFRFISREFSRAVCTRVLESLSPVPVVNLHGDAHLEQYAVTDGGRGLTDFDRATQGLAFLDHVRFGVSIHLACRANGWTEERESVVKDFFRGYCTALENPELVPPPPKLVDRIRKEFGDGHIQVLERAESSMEPMKRSLIEVGQAMKVYVEQMRVQYPETTASFFSIKKIGRLRLGIGSALDEKYLMRIEGETAAPEDDLILEVKEISEIDDLECIEVTSFEPGRILRGQARIAYNPSRYLGYFWMPSLRGSSRTKVFLVFAWDDNYQELSIDKSFESVEDLSSIAYDVGVQLGLGHPKEIRDPGGPTLRLNLSRIMEQRENDLQQTIQGFTLQTIMAWQHFCEEAEFLR